MMVLSFLLMHVDRTVQVTSQCAPVPSADVQFSPQEITFGSADSMSSKIQVQLSKKPTTNVTVYLKAPTLLFIKCTLHFTPENFDQPRTVKIMPSLKLRSNLSNVVRPPEMITALLAVPETTRGSARALVSNTAVNVNYQITSSDKTCTSTGYGPHISTMFGHKYLFNHAGNHFLVKSRRLDILVFQRTPVWSNTTTINTRVYIRFQNTFLHVFQENDTLQLETHASSPEDGLTSYTSNSQTFIFTLPDRSTIQISRCTRGYYVLDIAIKLSNFYKTGMSGLCSSFNDNAENFKAIGIENYFAHRLNATVKYDEFGRCAFPKYGIVKPKL